MAIMIVKVKYTQNGKELSNFLGQLIKTFPNGDSKRVICGFAANVMSKSAVKQSKPLPPESLFKFRNYAKALEAISQIRSSSLKKRLWYMIMDPRKNKRRWLWIGMLFNGADNISLNTSYIFEPRFHTGRIGLTMFSKSADIHEDFVARNKSYGIAVKSWIDVYNKIPETGKIDYPLNKSVTRFENAQTRKGKVFNNGSILIDDKKGFSITLINNSGITIKYKGSSVLLSILRSEERKFYKAVQDGSIFDMKKTARNYKGITVRG